MVAGGVDPVALLDAHKVRFVFLHVKVLKHLPAPGQYGTDFATTEIGHDDAVDWRAVFWTARDVGIGACFVEQEPPHVRPILQSLAMCRDALAGL